MPSFKQYPFSIPAVRSLKTLQFSPAVTFLIGENGSGKSTLIEAIAILAGFNPEGGSKSDPVSLDTVWTTMTAAKEVGHARQATEVHDSWQ